MSTCEICNQDMTLDKTESCTMVTIMLQGSVYTRVRHETKSRRGEPDFRCHDCMVTPGGYHHLGCDLERCPACGGQLIACGHWADPTGIDQPLREKLAAYSHGAWAQWMKYMFGLGNVRWAEPPMQSLSNPEKVWIMPSHLLARWQGQMIKPYEYLTNQEKQSDLAEADKILALMPPQLSLATITKLYNGFQYFRYPAVVTTPAEILKDQELFLHTTLRDHMADLLNWQEEQKS